MKVRNGFVTNSSSSSYTCLICGEVASGRDLGLDDAEMYECKNGHVFCESHALPVSEEALERDEDDDDYYEEDRYEFPIERCPICQFMNLVSEEGYKYLLKKTGLTEQDILNEIKGRYGSYEKFRKSLR